MGLPKAHWEISVINTQIVGHAKNCSPNAWPILLCGYMTNMLGME